MIDKSIQRLLETRYTNAIKVLLGLEDINFRVQETRNGVAYTYVQPGKNVDIFINPAHPMFNTSNKGLNIKTFLGVLVHEMLHKKYTNPEEDRKMIRRPVGKPILKPNLYKDISNIVEDFIIEVRCNLRLELSDKRRDRYKKAFNVDLYTFDPLKCLDLARLTSWRSSPPIHETDHPWNAFENAMLQFILGPFVPGSKISPDIQEDLTKILSEMVKAIEESPAKRAIRCKNIYDIVEKYLPKDVSEPNGGASGVNNDAQQELSEDEIESLNESDRMKSIKKILKKAQGKEGKGKKTSDESEDGEPSEENGKSSSSSESSEKGEPKDAEGSSKGKDKDEKSDSSAHDESGSKGSSTGENEEEGNPGSEKNDESESPDGEEKEEKTGSDKDTGTSENKGKEDSSEKSEEGENEEPAENKDDENEDEGDEPSESEESDPSESNSENSSDDEKDSEPKDDPSEMSEEGENKEPAEDKDDENEDEGNEPSESEESDPSESNSENSSDDEKDSDPKDKPSEMSEEGENKEPAEDKDNENEDEGNEPSEPEESDPSESNPENPSDEDDSDPFSCDADFESHLKDLESEIMKDKVDVNELLKEAREDVEKSENNNTDREIEKVEIPDMPAYGGNKIKCKNFTVTGVSEKTVEEYNKVVEENRKFISRFSQRLKNIINEEEKVDTAKCGRLRLTRYAQKSKTSINLFEKVSEHERGDCKVLIMLDVSGSMSGTKIKKAKTALVCIVEGLCRAGIPLKVMTFTEDSEPAVVHHHYVNYSPKKKTRTSIMTIEAGGNNFDGFSIRYGLKDLLKTKNRNTLIIVISDGQPASCFSCCNNEDAAAAVKEAKRKTRVIGIGIDSNKDILRQFYQDTFIELTNLEDLMNTLGRVIVKEARKWT